tara:strand:+ start:1188 stop:2003 length:816 start_codon:yes stop_codon:yes gene_type:complete
MIYLLLFITICILLLLYIRYETFVGVTTGNNIFKENNSTKYIGMGICIKNKSFGYRSNDKCITLSDLKKQKEQAKQQKSLQKKQQELSQHNKFSRKNKNCTNNKKKIKQCTKNDYNGFGECVNKDEHYCRKNYGKNYDQSFIKCQNNKVKYRCTKKESEIKTNEFVTKCYPKLSNFDDICNDEGWDKHKNPNYGVKSNTVYSKYLCPVGYSTATCSDLYKNHMNKYGDYKKISECIKIDEIDNYAKGNCASYNTRSGNYDCSVDKERVICY